MSFTKNSLFLLDGIGALVSALMLGYVLPHPLYYDLIGMPVGVMHGLATVAVIFAGYSLTCRWRIANYKPIWLKTIIAGNSLYSLLTIALMFIYSSQMTVLGSIYFTAELIVLVIIILIEVRGLREV